MTIIFIRGDHMDKNIFKFYELIQNTELFMFMKHIRMKRVHILRQESFLRMKLLKEDMILYLLIMENVPSEQEEETLKDMLLMSISKSLNLMNFTKTLSFLFLLRLVIKK